MTLIQIQEPTSKTKLCMILIETSTSLDSTSKPSKPIWPVSTIFRNHLYNVANYVAMYMKEHRKQESNERRQH